MYHGERFNAWTHLIGTALALLGTVLLIIKAVAGDDVRKMISATIFCATLILLYSASTLYHSLRGRAKYILRKLDHLSIYLLIAGTYTPFCLITLEGTWGWSLLGAVWALALIGMLQEIRPRSEARIMSLVIYAVMGWSIVFAVKPLIEQLATNGLLLLAGGGLSYTIGIIFYVFDNRFKHWHGIWHLFVLGGSLAHYLAIALYVV